MGVLPPQPSHPRAILQPYHAPGLFITGTGTDIGKTTVTAALAAAFRSLHIRVGICKPVASGCPKRADRGNDPGQSLNDDDFASPDAEILARAAGLNAADETLLPYLSPVRYAAPVAPALAARLEDRPPDWHRVAAAFEYWQENSDLLLVEGAGGWYVPVDGPPHDFMIADLAAALRLPVLVVTHCALGTLNETLLTVHAIRERNLPVIGLVINRVPGEDRRDLAMASNLEELPRLAGVPVRGILPEWPAQQGRGAGMPVVPDPLPEEFVKAMVPFATEWWEMVKGGAGEKS